MKSSRYLTIGLVAILLMTPLAGVAGKPLNENHEQIVEDTGVIKVEKIEVSGGVVGIGEKKVKEIYLIYGDKGTYAFGTHFKKYLPVNIDRFPEFKKEGLRVRFTGEIAIRNAFDAIAAMFSSIMQKPTMFVGGALPIKLVSIERISDETEDEEVNHQPVADFIYEPLTPLVGETVKFSDKSSDPDGDELSYLWDFGDGNHSTEMNPEHVYESAGLYMVTLKVADEEGLNDSITKEIEVVSSEEEIPVATVYGTVMEACEKKVPVSGAIISVFPTDSNPKTSVVDAIYKTKTDDDGKYNLEVESGRYLIVASKEGYMPSERMVEVKEDREVNFILKKIPAKKGLTLDVILEKKEIPIGEPIIVQAILTNEGDRTVRVCDIGLELGTLDLFITTPDGIRIHYIGPFVLFPLRTVLLEPGESISTVIDLTEKRFGTVKGSEPYSFDVPGDYSIFGIYKPYPPMAHHIPVKPMKPIEDKLKYAGIVSSTEYFTLLGKLADGEQ